MGTFAKRLTRMGWLPTLVCLGVAPATAQEGLPDTGWEIVAPPPAVNVPPAPPVAANHTTVYDVVTATPRLSEFGRALLAGGLAAELEQTGPYTLLAPDDAAFSQLPRGRLATLMRDENQAQLRNVLGAHVVRGYLSYPNLRLQLVANGGIGSLTTLDGGILAVKMEKGGIITIAGRGSKKGSVAPDDLPAFNGTVLTIGAVLDPPKRPKRS